MAVHPLANTDVLKEVSLRVENPAVGGGVHMDDEAIFSAPISLVGGWGVFFDFPEVSDASFLARGRDRERGHSLTSFEAQNRLKIEANFSQKLHFCS